jgi:hypothetical protein
MPSKLTDVTSRNFNPKLAAGLSDEARKAVNAAFAAMSTWRTEAVDNFEMVIDKMAAAARALGWPQQIVDATRAQMQDVIKMQIQTMDRMMDAWEEQIKSPSSSSAILSKLESVSSFSPAGSWPSAAVAQMTAFNPFGVYMRRVLLKPTAKPASMSAVFSKARSLQTSPSSSQPNTSW